MFAFPKREGFFVSAHGLIYRRTSRTSGATSDFNIKGNKFINYGLDNGTNKAAFKIWGDGVLAPTENKGGTLNAPATVLAESIKANNTFSTGDNCVVAEFYGAVLALD